MTEKKQVDCSSSGFGRCLYKIGDANPTLILCVRCGRIRAIKTKDGWENLY